MKKQTKKEYIEEVLEDEFDKLELFDLSTKTGRWDRKLALNFIFSKLFKGEGNVDRIFEE